MTHSHFTPMAEGRIDRDLYRNLIEMQAQLDAAHAIQVEVDFGPTPATSTFAVIRGEWIRADSICCVTAIGPTVSLRPVAVVSSITDGSLVISVDTATATTGIMRFNLLTMRAH